MSGVIKIRATEVLGALIELAIPELAGSVCSLAPDDGHTRRLPSLAIITMTTRFTFDQDDDWKEIGDNRLIICAGQMDITAQLQIGSKSPFIRAKLEQAVTQLFFSQAGRSGIIVAEIADCHDAIVAYELNDESWRDEAGFGDKWFSATAINIALPILVERGNVFPMNEIRVATRATATATFDQVSAATQESIAVDELGNITISTNPA